MDGCAPPIRGEHIARDLVHHHKYGDRFDLATAMAQWMVRRQALLRDDKRRHSSGGFQQRTVLTAASVEAPHSSRLSRRPRGEPAHSC
jgi:predicted amidophosphoribosyltransferase